MATIGVVVRAGVPEAKELARSVFAWAAARQHSILLEEETGRLLGSSEPAVSAEQLARMADPVVSLGGDGTLIGVARYVSGPSPLMIGVNFGNLGFLTEVSPAELLGTLDEVFAGRVNCGERAMLYAEIWRDGQLMFSSQAVNDAVVQKGAVDRLLDLDVFVDGEAVMRLRADGVIVAAPTGSTAYSLAAGGSIVHPALSVMLVTPVCPHSLTSRPLVLPLECRLQVRVPPYDGEVFLLMDGQVSHPVASGDTIVVTRSSNRVRFVRSSTKSYFAILRTKLNWGLPNKAE